MSPDRARTFTIEQERERRDDRKGPCPGPRANTDGHKVPARGEHRHARQGQTGSSPGNVIRRSRLPTTQLDARCPEGNTQESRRQALVGQRDPRNQRRSKIAGTG